MDNLTLQQIRDTIGKSDRIAIAVGRQANIDDMAAALSLYLSLTQMNKKVSIASATQPTVELSSLVGINKVKAQLDGDSGDLVVSFPYREGEIEKVSYTIDNGYLNIVVKAGVQGLTFQEADIRFTRGGGAPTVLFVIGTPRLSDLGTLFDPEALKNTTIINIDNKTDNQGYGDVVLVSPAASSVSELAANILSYLAADIDVDIAQNLLSGISFATENFQSQTTSATAFEMAGFLLKRGAMRGSVAGRPAPFKRNEDRVSTFMPEVMKSSPIQTNRPPLQSASQPQAGVRAKTPPSDWLAPKVYKGTDKFK